MAEGLERLAHLVLRKNEPIELSPSSSVGPSGQAISGSTWPPGCSESSWSSSHPGYDGVFEAGPMAGKTVNGNKAGTAGFFPSMSVTSPLGEGATFSAQVQGP